jgi:hypothetical protein
MSKKDLSYFVRFGGLNALRQDGFGEPWFHSPPAPRGFYAMPLIAQEHWLLEALPSTQPDQFPKFPESPTEEDRKVHGDNALDKHLERQKVAEKQFHRKIRKEFRKTHGFLWHHLGEYVDNCDVVERCNSWVKTSLRTWQKAFRKCSINNRYGLYFEDKRAGESVSSINAAKGLAGSFTKEHFEVFIDEKV